MKIAMITFEFYPKFGGISHTSQNLCKSFKKKNEKLYIFNPFYKGKNIFDILTKRTYKFSDYPSMLLKKKNRRLLLFVIKRIVTSDRILLFDKLKIILYLLYPKIAIQFINNLKSLIPYFKRIKFDIVFGTATGGPTITLSYLLSIIFNLKVVCLSHGDDFLIENPISLKSCFFKYLDKIILSNIIMKNLFKKIHRNISDRKLKIINRGIFPQEYHISEGKFDLRKKFNLPQDSFILLSVGNHVKRKGFDLVIKAVKNLVSKISKNVYYILIGEGEFTEKLVRLSKELEIEENIKFLGEVNNNLRNKYYKASDVFLMPSRVVSNSLEGFGIVFLEANYYKLPVIGTKTGGINRAIINEKTGFLIKPNNLDELTKYILFLYNNKEICEDMGEFGNKRVLKEYNWNILVEDYIKTFKEILRNN
ncbi:MAG: glycosyltransferase family 4 protein [Candidatus Lokiarchaeota archaeon]